MLRPLLAVLFGIFVAGAAQASGPLPPCSGSPVPAYPAEQGPPQLGMWSGSDLRQEAWQPAPCLGWSGDSRLVVALSSAFRSPLSLDQLLQRLTSISAYPSVKYWSATRSQWRPLASEAGMIAQPDGKTAVADPAASDLTPGRDFYYFENGEVGGRTIHRLRVVEHGPDRAVVTSQNIRPIRVAFVTIFEPGALQYETYIERVGPGLYHLYQIARVGMASSSLAASYSSSYANRLEALRRYLAGLPTDGAPALRAN